MSSAIEKLRAIQQDEINNGFVNGQLYNDIEDMIYKLENPSHLIESEQGEIYAGKTRKQIGF